MKRIVSFALFPAAGIVAAIVRAAQRRNAFTRDDLLIPGCGTTTALIVLSVVVAVGALVFARLCRRRAAQRLPELSGGEQGCFITGVVAGFLIIVGGLLTAMEHAPQRHIAWLVLAALLVISGALLVLVLLRRRADAQTPIGSLLLLPAFTGCLWLVLLYQANAAEPVLMDYIFALLAVICIVLGLYFTVALAYGLLWTRRTVFAALMAGYFSLLCIGDAHLTLGMRVLLIAFALHLLLQAGMLLLSHGKGKRERSSHVE